MFLKYALIWWFWIHFNFFHFSFVCISCVCSLLLGLCPLPFGSLLPGMGVWHVTEMEICIEHIHTSLRHGNAHPLVIVWFHRPEGPTFLNGFQDPSAIFSHTAPPILITAPFSSHPPEKSSQKWSSWSLQILRVCFYGVISALMSVYSLARAFTTEARWRQLLWSRSTFRSPTDISSLSLGCAVAAPASNAESTLWGCSWQASSARPRSRRPLPRSSFQGRPSSTFNGSSQTSPLGHRCKPWSFPSVPLSLYYQISWVMSKSWASRLTVSSFCWLFFMCIYFYFYICIPIPS